MFINLLQNFTLFIVKFYEPSLAQTLSSVDHQKIRTFINDVIKCNRLKVIQLEEASKQGFRINIWLWSNKK